MNRTRPLGEIPGRESLMSSIASVHRPRAVGTCYRLGRMWGKHILYVVTFIAIFAVLPTLLSWLVLENSVLELRFDRFAFVVITSIFGWLALLLEVNRSPNKNLLTSAIILNFVMVLLISVVLMFSRFYYSRPYIALFFLANTLMCYVAKEYVVRLRHRRVTFLTPQASSSTRADLGNEVEVNTDPKRSLRAVDLVLIDFRQPLPPEFGRAISGAALTGLPVMHVAQYLEEKEGRISLDHITDSDFWTHWSPPTYLYAKRCIDIGMVLFVAPLALFLFLIASVAILVTMGRPVIFKQERVSRRGSNFLIYKLRTMAPVAVDAPQTATSLEDRRITPVGAFLRRYRLDELPQLWNILRGDMSLIGPRPEQPKLVERYEREIPCFGLRHMVRPGLSGWAQVKYGYAGNTEETASKLAYDLYYIKNLSLDMDLQIFLRTVKTVLVGNGAR
jgi:lipopolysaccharide/colanic/teichoic acid biosynthesis glycosyltransferase